MEDILDNLVERASLLIKRVILIVLLFIYILYSQNSFCTKDKNNYSIWIDIPIGDLRKILFIYDSKLDNLNNIIRDYHKISKTEWNTVEERIEALRNIQQESMKVHKLLSIKDKGRRRYLAYNSYKIYNIAFNKEQYLRKLLDLRIFDFSKLYDVSQFPKKYTPLFIKNKNLYNFKYDIPWGHFLLGIVDPAHRRNLNAYYISWNNNCKNCN